jgi:hypothetical protein
VANVTIAYRNWADDGTFSSGSWAASLPLTNFQDQQPTKKARSSDATTASTKFDIDLGSAKVTALVAMIHHNCSQSATWRVRISNDNTFATSLSDSGWVDVWPDAEVFGALMWGEFNWNGKLDATEAADFGPIGYYYLGSSPVIGRYIRVEVSDTANADGYVEAGRVMVSPIFQPAKNLAYGWSMEFIDDSKKTISRGGQSYVDVIQKRRRLTIPLHSLTEAEAMAQGNNLVRIKGRSGDLLAVIDIEDETNRLRQSLYGLFAEMPAITQSGPITWEQTLVLEELR